MLKGYISDIINSRFNDLDIDINKIANTTAINALAEIQEIISNNNYSDFEAIEEIVNIFVKYHLDFGDRHDF